MMTTPESMLKEFLQELAITKRVLARVPGDKLTWKPHDRSMSLGQLALHIALVPGGIIKITTPDTFDVSTSNFSNPSPETLDEVHAALEQSARDVEQALGAATEQTAQSAWHLMHGERELSAAPRLDAWRSLLLNHWYHHRGQLTVYLRLLDVAVPSVYGPSADERPVF